MKLALFLRRQNLTAAKFAGQIGVSPSTITRLLNDERRPGIDLIERITVGSGGKVTAKDFMLNKAAA